MATSKAAPLTLTVQERWALSAALKTTLRLWGDSENRIQERVLEKLKCVLRKLEAHDKANRELEANPNQIAQSPAGHDASL
jgi:hypothetical protein